MYLELKDIPLFIKVSNKSKKTGKPKWVKPNMQNLYSGTMHHFTRDKVVKELHNYVENCIDTVLEEEYAEPAESRIKFIENRIKIYLHCDYSISKVKIDELGNYKYPNKNYSVAEKMYKYRWDLDNFMGLWVKVILDSLVTKGVFEDDSVAVINHIGYKHEYREADPKLINSQVDIVLKINE